MLYKKNKEAKIDKELFQNPTAEYRGTPFWSWNCKLDRDQLERQIEYLKEMGFGGFHIHSRTGMATEYLSDEFMSMVDVCVTKAENEDMLAWLYDEDRWPSGSAGGIVTKNPKYRQRKLLFTVTPLKNSVDFQSAAETGEPALLASFDVKLSNEGTIAEYRRIAFEQKAYGTKWYAYMVTRGAEDWFNGQSYLDTLDAEAVQEFIRVTYERYYEVEGERFDKIIPAIFTDEPQFARKQTLKFPQDKNDVYLPWTPKMAESYQQEYGEDILDYIPELFWDLENNAVSVHRYHYHDHLSKLFAENFAGQCGKWCGENNLCLTGHLMEEPTLWSQTSMIGDAMRSYPSFQIPGIDMLCAYFEFTTAKQAQSIVHQSGREAMLSELYGVTGWDFDFRGHKIHGDWQAALGVTVRVPHLSWVSMEGDAKRDYPASINYQSPWYKEYTYVEDHFARVNTAMTRGKSVVKVGVIHPVESYWLHWGPEFTTDDIRNQMDERFQSLTKWLLSGCIDFDFVCEALLPEQCPKASSPLKVGQMKYDVIIVPACETLRSTTIKRLRNFREQGGKLIFLGQAPKYVDAVASNEAEELYKKSNIVGFERIAILNALDEIRDLEIRNSTGERTQNLIYQMRQDTDCRWLFIAHCEESLNKDIAAECPQNIRIIIKGEYKPILWQTLDGTRSEMPYYIENGNTVIETTIYDFDSLLIQLTSTNGEGGKEKQAEHRERIFEKVLMGKVLYKRCEPNVLLLDRAKYSLDGEAFNNEEEILRLNDKCRSRLGWPSKADGNPKQPWVILEEEITHSLTMEFTINSKIYDDNIMLAAERAEEIKIEWNGNEVDSEISGYYVDEAIKILKLPPVCKGKNILRITMPFGKRTCPEWCYILGEFNVAVEGTEACIMPIEKEIGFSDISRQGLAFYGGNVIYEAEIETPEGDMEIHVPHYRGAMVKAALDDVDCGIIAYAPYNLIVRNVSAGKHKLTFTLYGNRYNTFGSLHDAENVKWVGPTAWLTKGDRWSYSYNLRETGILSGPIISVYK